VYFVEIPEGTLSIWEFCMTIWNFSQFYVLWRFKIWKVGVFGVAAH